MKKGFALSIVLWITIIFIAISIYFLQISKTTLSYSEKINDKLVAFLKAKSLLENLKFYIGTGHFVYNKVYNEVRGFPKFLRIDGYTYNLDNEEFSLQDISGLYRLWDLDKTFEKFLQKRNITQLNSLIMYNSYKDWIDKDNISREYGAEKEYYSERNYAYFPRNSNIPLLFEVLDIRGWRNNFNKIKNYITLGDVGITNNFTAMPLEILQTKYNISYNDINFLKKLKEENKMKKFINYFYQISKDNFNYETDTYFNSKIVMIKIISIYKKAKYSFFIIINFKKNIIKYINF